MPLKWRISVIVALCALSIWALFPRDITVRTRNAQGVLQNETVRKVPLKKGLDLSGGMYLSLEVDDSKQKIAPSAKAEAIDRALKVQSPAGHVFKLFCGMESVDAPPPGDRPAKFEHVSCKVWNHRAEERFLDNLQRGYVAISTTGAIVGQINALTVRDLGDQAFGRPSRVTARAAIGRRGVLNIERIVDLGGKSQQKGVLVVEGYLRGRFGRIHPLAFDCSLTFEQNYGGVDGDSASVAELVAILSAVSQVPIRQDLAVTGSFNQLGEVQAVGDVIEKVEGFFRATEADRAAGRQTGVLLPAANLGALILDDDVIASMRAGQFHIWGIRQVEEAISLLCAQAIGAPCNPDRLYRQVEEQLAGFNAIIRQEFSGLDGQRDAHD